MYPKWFQSYLLDELLLVGMFLSQIGDLPPQCFILPKQNNELGSFTFERKQY